MKSASRYGKKRKDLPGYHCSRCNTRHHKGDPKFISHATYKVGL